MNNTEKTSRNGFTHGLSHYEPEPNLARASTLPADWYIHPHALKWEMEKVFPQTWQLVARLDQLQEPGSYVTAKVAKENLVVVRGSDQKLRAFDNVCRHRAGPVAMGCGKHHQLQCKYHGWTYSLEGELKGTPEFQGVENFRREDFRLPTWEVASFGPLVFVAKNPRMNFSDYLGEIPGELAYLQPTEMTYLTTVEYKVPANWKVYVDNYLEGYHLPLVHPRLSRELDYSRYYVETRTWHSTQGAPPKESAELYAGSDRPGAHYYWNFPNFMLNIYQGLMQTNVVIPDGPERCRIRFDWFARTSKLVEVKEKLSEIMKFSDEIQAEDAMICERVQENLNSSSYKQGRFSVKRENGVHQFHTLLAKWWHDDHDSST